ncbi:MAG TPA: M12 family metallopeptidase, partial [Longimicrobium sp.]
GDIDLGPAGLVPRTLAELRRRERPDVDDGGPPLGVVTSNLSRRWGYGQVPYVIESTVPNPSRITSAMTHIEQNAHGVDFVPRTSHGSWIIFRRTTDPNICGQSPVGRQGGGQVVLIHDNCGMGTAVHEILHSLGFWHEQSRCDRDGYVEILWNNIETGRSSQFDRYCSGASTVHAYDEGSIMHYPYNAFGKVVNGVRLQTIRSLRGLEYLMGQSSGLSTQDIYTVDWMYQPYAPSGVSSSYPGGTPTISWNAYSTATHYSVELVSVYEEWDYERGYSSWEGVDRLVGSTTGLTLQDPQATYTGNQYCDVYNSNYTTAYYTYWYQVVAHLPGGAVSMGARTPAYISTC